MKKFRIIAIALCLCLAATALVGCGEKKEAVSDNGEALKVFFKFTNLPDCATVSQELSKLVEEKLGFKVELMFGYTPDKITLMLASNEQMDIGFDDYNNFVDRVRANAYVDITDMLEEKAPKLYKAVPKEMWEGSKINGRNYAVPTYKEYAEVWTVLAEEKIVNESGVNPDEVDELKDIEPILATLKNNYPDRAGYQILSASTVHMNMALKNKYDTAYGDFVVNREQPDKVVHFMETPEYREHVNLMRDWYEKGYIAKDVTTRTDYSAYNNSGNVGVIYTSYHPYAESTAADQYHCESLIPMHVSPVVKSNTSMTGSLYAIYSKSKNVDNALKFLELWNTDPEIKNMITYGIEGKHYNLVDGKVKRIEGALDLYNVQNPTSGNCTISYLLETDPDDKYEAFQTFSENAITAATLGFFPDVTNVKSKIGACTSAVNEYNPLLLVGALEPDQYLDKMLSALKAAGVDDVKAEIQKQYDEWRK